MDNVQTTRVEFRDKTMSSPEFRQDIFLYAVDWTWDIGQCIGYGRPDFTGMNLLADQMN